MVILKGTTLTADRGEDILQRRIVALNDKGLLF